MRTHEFHYYMDAEKEELYLNDQAKRGRALTGYFLWRYTFEDCEPGEYIYRCLLYTSFRAVFCRNSSF